MGWTYGYTGRCALPDDRPDVSRRLAVTMATQRRGRERPEYGRRSGRCDARNLWRTAVDDGRVFKQPGAASPTRLRVVVLQDLSGSMEGQAASFAAQMTWDLIGAATQVPTVSLEVWGHTTQGIDSASGDSVPEDCHLYGGSKGFIKLMELWRPGTTRHAFHHNILSTGFSGNEDGWVIKVLSEDVEKRLKPRERMVLVVVSDGLPIYSERGSEQQHVKHIVDQVRRRGHAVISVAISSGLSLEEQRTMYGPDYVIPYDRNTNRLTRAVARALGRALD